MNASERREAPRMNMTDEWNRAFRSDLEADAAFEKRLLLKEACIIAVIALLVLLRKMVL